MNFGRIAVTIGKEAGKIGKVTRHSLQPTIMEDIPALQIDNGCYGKIFILRASISHFLALIRKEFPAFKELTEIQKEAFGIIEDLGKSVPEMYHEPFINRAKNFVESPSAPNFYRAALLGEYSKIRLANYPPLPTEARNIAEITSKEAEGILTANIKGWHCRGKEVGSVPQIRISINANADAELITNLDNLLREEANICQYKAPESFEEWHTRHDPITIYLSEKPSAELIEKLKKATEGHIRSNENLIGTPITEGMTIDQIPSKKSIAHFVDEVAQYDESFATYLDKVYFRDGYSLSASTGSVQAARNLLEKLKKQYPNPNSFSKSVGFFSFKENPERTVEEFVKLFDEKHYEVKSIPEPIANCVHLEATYNPEGVAKSEILMDFIRNFPNSGINVSQEYGTKILEELERIAGDPF